MTKKLSTAIDPVHFRLSTLLSLDTETVHELCVRSAGTLSSYRLVLGRCLLAIQESRAYREFGCSGAIHYATAILGLDKREARECRRVARALLGLPQLTIEAELGKISWSKLREIVRKASPETEALWVELVQQYSSDEIGQLVAQTPEGAVPGDVDENGDSYKCELRCRLRPEVFQMLDQARRVMSLEQEQAVTNAEILEWSLAAYISRQPLDDEALRRVREEADKDLQAERARKIPIVQAARELAEEMGISSMQNGDEKTTRRGREDEDALLETALGMPAPSDYSPESSAPEENGIPACGTTPPGREQNPDLLHEILQQFTENLVSAKPSWYNSKLRFNPKARNTTKAQKKEILRRDGWCCSAPGCPNRIWLDVHHIVPYSKGGTTAPNNLKGLCRSCHKNHHDGFLQINFERGKLIFRDRHGERLDEQADLAMATWLNKEIGYSGEEHECFRYRLFKGEWTVFSP